MSAAVIVRKAYKTYQSLSAPLGYRGSPSNRSSSSNRTYRFGGTLTAGVAGKSGLLDQLPAVVAIDRVSFTVEEGQIFGLIGPNGSGKSTLLRLLATLLSLDGGQIQIFGLDSARQAMQIRRLINPVAGEASFFRKLSPLDNLIQDGRQYGMDDRETRHQVLDLLTGLGMQERFILSPMEAISASHAANGLPCQGDPGPASPAAVGRTFFRSGAVWKTPAACHAPRPSGAGWDDHRVRNSGYRRIRYALRPDRNPGPRTDRRPGHPGSAQGQSSDQPGRPFPGTHPEPIFQARSRNSITSGDRCGATAPIAAVIFVNKRSRRI